MKIKYYFVEPKKEKSAMMISIAWNGKRIQTSIGLSQLTSSFDIDKQKFKRSAVGYAQLNNHLDKIRQEVHDFYYNSIATNKIVVKKDLNDFLYSILVNKKDDTKDKPVITIKYLVDSFISDINENPLYKKMTLKKYKTFQNNIHKFLGKHNNIEFESLDYQYLQKLAIFLSSSLKLSDSTIQKTLKMFSRIFNKAFEDEIIKSQFYKPLFTKLYKGLKLKTDSKKFSLTKEDISKIEMYETIDESLKLTKDLFLFEVYTAQRVSDLFKTNIAAVDLNQKTLTFRQTKTSEMVSIPLIDKALNIIRKYPKMKFPKISEQYYNRKIKELAKNAGLTDYIQIEHKSLNKIEIIVKQKWELISSHHARVTCIVNMAQNGALPEEIISVTGHSNPRSIEPYMRIAADEKKKRSRNALERAFG